MYQYDLPLKMIRRNSNKESVGCMFHWHEQLEFYYVLSGGVELVCKGEKDWIYAGDIAFVNWCEPHKSISFLDNTLHYIIQFDISMLYGRISDICEEKYFARLIDNTITFPTFIKNEKILAGFFDTMIQEYENKNYGYEIVIKAQAMNVLAQLFRNSYKNDGVSQDRRGGQSELNYVKNILMYIHENFSQEIRLEQIAKELGISIPHMCRIFKRLTGMTIVKYINQLRCYRAASLIMAGHMITDAGLLVGFNDYNYFSRIFKKIMGLSPSDYTKSKTNKKIE